MVGRYFPVTFLPEGSLEVPTCKDVGFGLPPGTFVQVERSKLW